MNKTLKSRAITRRTKALSQMLGMTARSSELEPIEKPREKIKAKIIAKTNFSTFKIPLSS